MTMAGEAAARTLQALPRSVFSRQEFPALRIRVANISFCLERAAGLRRDVLGLLPALQGKKKSLFLENKSQSSDFLLSVEKFPPAWCLFLDTCAVAFTLQPVITWIANCLITI